MLPWQRELGYADDDATLSWTTRTLFEQQANQGAAELLFQRDLFGDMAAQYEIGIASILELAELVVPPATLPCVVSWRVIDGRWPAS